MPARYAAALSALDGDIAEGSEDRVTDEVQHWTGRRPADLKSFLAAHATLLRA
ncbi:hypothetical protein [Methylobacterium oryzisoli]|uniref:hypothetical protein n=1 Tax=Methylobacterium oryzisoli TaxID=3385502 RepID=UPI003891F6BA